ncbi:hypothetical protein E1180_11695 [Roseibium denhamense]|uniref:Sulfotransferase family protein n=1 Tax=Roseibium denhamense TaxID=76305 RepID=A0ABY1PE11_9HYPH|nr:sulfotransferase family 2 domain-containing protein [Roseibium denhamense]MTI06177.1 hypothetical protein [Roseibium denhamense]SMP32392.1 hypothetical protein SAMN06265374_3530 [Roseibium denhamense]
MLTRVYSLIDRRHRPLRNHVYLVFPDFNIAYARVNETAFKLLEPVLLKLAGIHDISPCPGHFDREELVSETKLFHGNVELLTARELKRRYPDIKTVAWVQNPLHRLAYCYEKIIKGAGGLPYYYGERRFSPDMTPEDFVSQVAAISDLEADNLFRSQWTALTHKGQFIPDLVLQVEQYDCALSDFLTATQLDCPPDMPERFSPSDFVSSETLNAFSSDPVSARIAKRYRNDYQAFYEGRLAAQ